MKPARDPLADESLDGYLAYRAEHMGLPNILEFAELVGINGNGRIRVSRCDTDLGDVAELLAMPREYFNQLANPLLGERWRRRYLGISVHVMHLARMRRHFAARALTLSPHHRTLWDLRPFPFDEESWELLGHRCPNPICGRSQGWHHTRGIDRCDECGGPLNGELGEVVAHEDRAPLAAALGLIHPDAQRRAACQTKLPERLKLCDRGYLLDLLVGLANVVDPSLSAQNHRWCLKKDLHPAKVTRAVARAWPLLTGWPDAFEDFALDRAMQTARGRGDGNGGGTARFLRLSDLMKSPSGLALIIAEERRRLETAGNDRGIGAVAATNLRGLRASDISRARRDGKIGVVASMRRGLFIPLLVRSEVEKLSQLFVDTLPLNRAAIRLGCGRLGVEQLSAMRLIGPDGPIVHITGHEPRVLITALTDLARRIEAQSKPLSKGIALAKAFRGFGGTPKPIGPLVRAILRGQLDVQVSAGNGPVLSRVSIAPDDVPTLRVLAFERAWHPEHPFVEMVSKVEAGWELNLKSSSWVDLLSCWPTDGKLPVVPVSWLMKTMAAGISVPEICARNGRFARSVHAEFVRTDKREILPSLYDRPEIEAAFAQFSGRSCDRISKVET